MFCFSKKIFAFEEQNAKKTSVLLRGNTHSGLIPIKTQSILLSFCRQKENS